MATKTTKTTPKKRASRQPAKAKPSVNRSTAPLIEAELVEKGVMLPVDKIEPHPQNVRQEFGDLADLESIKVVQLQEISVRQIGGGKYQLIAGERRWRAAMKFKLPALRANIIECDDQTALFLLGAENLARRNLNAIEEALFLSRMLESSGMTQRQLADHLQRQGFQHCSQGFIGNRVRLLKLPERWRNLVRSGSLSESHARELATWAHRPAVMDDLWEDWNMDADGEFETPTVSDLVHQLRCSARAVSRSMRTGQYDHLPDGNGGTRYLPVLITKATFAKHEQNLDVEEVPGYHGAVEKRAFNTELWDRLQTEAEAKSREKQRTRDQCEPAANGKPAKTPGLSAAEKKKRRQKVWYRYRIEWLQREIARRLPELMGQAILTGNKTIPVCAVWRLLIYFASRHGEHYLSPETKGPLNQALEAQGVQARGSTSTGVFQALHNLDEPWALLMVMQSIAATYLQEPQRNQTKISPEEIEIFAKSIGIDYAADWKPDDPFYDLLNGEEITHLAEVEWKVTVRGTKDEKIRMLIDSEAFHTPALPEFMNVKPIEIRW